MLEDLERYYGLVATGARLTLHPDALELSVPAGFSPEQGVVTFTPAFGFVPGTDYVARIHTVGRDVEWVPFRLAAETAPANAAVTDVYPSADVLPENTLRFYVCDGPSGGRRGESRRGSVLRTRCGGRVRRGHEQG